MKLDRLETHDRLLYFKKQSDYISQGCQDCINGRPEEFKNHPFYIFAHARTEDDGVNKRLIWTPRLTKPKAQTNSLLFKAYPPSDKIKIIWMIPARELWNQFKKGNMIANKTIVESLYEFQHHRDKLEAREEDDLSDEVIDQIYKEISMRAKPKILETY